MSQAGKFQPGHDARRNVSSGRSRTGASIAAVIRRTLGHDVQRVCEQVKTLAAGGDPEAIIAAAVLLASVAQSRHAAERTCGACASCAADAEPSVGSQS
ncbi:MAG: hypothetical protein AB7O64_14160 [Methylibium sp.]